MSHHHQTRRNSSFNKSHNDGARAPARCPGLYKRRDEPCHPELDPAKSKAYLTQAQITAVGNLLHERIFEISSKEDQGEIFTIRVTLGRLLQDMTYALKKNGISVLYEGLRLIGSAAASTLLAAQPEDKLNVNDVDLCIYGRPASYDLPRSHPVDFYQVVRAEEACIQRLVEEQSGVRLSPKQICDRFFTDCLKVENDDERWSLITLTSAEGINIDIKFVQKSRRPFVFSTDSFEIILDPFIRGGNASHSPEKVRFESTYGDAAASLDHLRNGTLKTRDAAKIRGGLFRFCLELSKGRVCESPIEYQQMQSEFCASFFQDFDQAAQLECVLAKFISKHRKHAPKLLKHLYEILAQSHHINKVEFLSIIPQYQSIAEQITASTTHPNGLPVTWPWMISTAC